MSKKVKGLMVFYLDVGSLPHHAIEEYIEYHKDAFKKKEKKLKKSGIECAWIAVKPNSQTRVEYFPTEDNNFTLQDTDVKQEIEIEK